MGRSGWGVLSRRAVRLRVRVLEEVMVGEGVESVRPMVTAGWREGRMMRPSPRPVILGSVGVF